MIHVPNPPLNSSGECEFLPQQDVKQRKGRISEVRVLRPEGVALSRSRTCASLAADRPACDFAFLFARSQTTGLQGCPRGTPHLPGYVAHGRARFIGERQNVVNTSLSRLKGVVQPELVSLRV